MNLQRRTAAFVLAFASTSLVAAAGEDETPDAGETSLTGASPEPDAGSPSAERRKPLPAPPSRHQPVKLSGHAECVGGRIWRGLRLFNEGTLGWTRCDLKLLPRGGTYELPALQAGDSEFISLSKFIHATNEDFEFEPSYVEVRCYEGDAKYEIVNRPL